ncbi:MAG: VOC family protein [Caldilineales bacterium]|nr:VOC family protein [Caldilineales bacterium]
MNPTLPDSTHIGSVHLTAADLSKLKAFYIDALGFRELVSDAAGIAVLGADGQTPLLVLHAAPNAIRKPPRTTGLYHFAILFPDRRSLAVALRHLLEIHYPLQGASDHLVSEAIYLADPEGNGIEIYTDRPRDQWPRLGDTIQMATEPLDAQGLMAELETPGTNDAALPEGTIIGHIHLHVDQIESARRFYCDVLGFDLVTRYGPSALFVSAGGYHHHIGLNTWAGVGAPPPPENSSGLRYYDILVPDADALLTVERRLAEAGVRFNHETENGLHLKDPAGTGIRLAVAPKD